MKAKAKSPKIKAMLEISDDLVDVWADIRPKPTETKKAKDPSKPDGPFVLNEHEMWIVHLLLEKADNELFDANSQQNVAEALYRRLDTPKVLRPWKDLGTPVLKISPKQAKKIRNLYQKSIEDANRLDLFRNLIESVE